MQVVAMKRAWNKLPDVEKDILRKLPLQAKQALEKLFAGVDAEVIRAFKKEALGEQLPYYQIQLQVTQELNNILTGDKDG